MMLVLFMEFNTHSQLLTMLQELLYLSFALDFRQLVLDKINLFFNIWLEREGVLLQLEWNARAHW